MIKYISFFAMLLGLLPSVLQAQVATLTEEERDGLVFMAEEEKMARDVYLVLKEQWTLPAFDNISRAEQFHIKLVSDLAGTYDVSLPDPVVSDEKGVFSNPQLQRMYNELVARGKTSLVEAFRVGALIEETDIQDLTERLEQTDDPAMRNLYQRLRRASGNHLRAFSRHLEARGADYQPQVLDRAEYDRIVGRNAG